MRVSGDFSTEKWESRIGKNRERMYAWMRGRQLAKGQPEPEPAPGIRDIAALEKRRKEAKKYLDDGHGLTETARKFGVTRTTVCRWRLAQSLDATKATGRPHSVKRELIRELLASRPDWNCFTLRDAIEAKFGKRYNHDHVGRILTAYRREAESAALSTILNTPRNVKPKEKETTT